MNNCLATNANMLLMKNIRTHTNWLWDKQEASLEVALKKRNPLA
jgi:hypothetical protein